VCPVRKQRETFFIHIERIMQGLLNLNKPVGLTSRQVVNRVQRAIKPVKAGHAGTLDPLATGVLVVCLGKATRLIQYVQELPKTYQGTFELGTVSSTCDAEGELTETGRLDELAAEDLLALLPRFLGDIEQVPPRHSAVHVNGERAYELARQDADFELEPRTIHIESLELLDWSFPRFRLEIECGSGTYIRSLGRDLGEALGCGAYMTELERTSIGEFSLAEAIDVEDLTAERVEQHLIPPGEAVRHLPRAIVSSAFETEILHGKQFLPERWESRSETADSRPVAVYDQDERLLCLAECLEGSERLQPRQVFVKREKLED